MFKNRDGAVALNQILQQISRLIDEGCHLLQGEKFTDEERGLYGYNMAGMVLGVEIFDLFEEIYYEHPDLVPPGAKPWPVFPPRSKRFKQQLTDLEQNARTHYEVLQIDPRAETGLIQQAHKYLIAKYRAANKSTGNQEMADKVDAAWRVVGDPKKRAAYDESIRQC